MNAVVQYAEAFNQRLGAALSWLTVSMAVLQFLIIGALFFFGVGSIWLQEGVVYMHGFLFMLAAAYTLVHDGHVRVDIFYRSYSPRTKALVNLSGSILFLLPIACLVFFSSLSYVQQSWSILESSAETSGIKAVYLLKTAIPAFAVLLLLQAFCIVLRCILVLRRQTPPKTPADAAEAVDFL